MADLPLDDPRALTLRPQWAHAIAWHGKRIENRSWAIPDHLVGKRVALHAGAFPGGAWWDEVRAASGGFVPRYPRPVPIERRPGRYEHPAHAILTSRLHPDALQCRAIVATAVLRPATASEALSPWADAYSEHWWFLEDVQVLARVVLVRRGKLGLWRLDEETAEAVRAAEVLRG